MNFLILSRKPDIYSTRRLVEELSRRGHCYSVENPEGPFPAFAYDAVLPRLGQYRYTESLESLCRLEKAHPSTIVFNRSEAFHQSRHKKIAGRILAEHQLPQPRIYESPDHFPVVAKDCLSSQGLGVFLCRSQVELKALVSADPRREWLFQEWIEESSGRDVRAFVIGSEVAGAMERRATRPGEFRSNLSLGGVGQAVVLTAEEERLCLQAVQALALDYAGVDFVRSHRGPLLLEVNPCPGLEGIEKYTRKNIAEKWVLYAESRFDSYLD